MRKYEKLAITMPIEMVEVLDMYAEFEGVSRSGAIAYLIAQGLAVESSKTNGFDFDTPVDVIVSDDGEKVVLKRSDIDNYKTTEWTFALGRNRRREYVSVSSKDFEEIDKEQE